MSGRTLPACKIQTSSRPIRCLAYWQDLGCRSPEHRQMPKSVKQPFQACMQVLTQQAQNDSDEPVGLTPYLLKTAAADA